MFAFFLSSGLFLGWSLGANDAANVFGTAVGTRMISFRKAAVYCGIFVILGAVISGAGAARTLGELGSVNAIAGAFVVALAAAITVYGLTYLGYPVSTTQAIVGAIIGWSLFAGALIDYVALEKIVLSWVISPVLAGIFSALLYMLIAYSTRHAKINMFNLDSLTRSGLLIAGVAGAYALGANNIANVVGIFVPISPFADLSILGVFRFSGAQQLFFIGAAAIAIGTFTYGKRVMLTVGQGITEMSPVAALVAVLANALVLFLFASQDLERFLLSIGLPAFPLVPVSSSQAIVGSVIGIGLVKGGRGIRWRVLGEIAGAWVVTPLAAILISFISLFFLQNVFQQKTYIPVKYQVTEEAEQRVRAAGIRTTPLGDMIEQTYLSAAEFRKALSQRLKLDSKDMSLVMSAAKIDHMVVTLQAVNRISDRAITDGQKKAVQTLWGKHFTHRWQLEKALADLSPEWRMKPGDKDRNVELRRELDYIHRLIRANMQ
ncbi:MAG: inorganic phosphate transporter family protein [Proteobacteria bacterium]|nr:inorganic phosphate transporter family protein [Pseudomonadota bacterium]MBU2227688.1 inorganic phosphate transporter family protein [Pseudomonadota bacterium]MBU2260431.1 inorganic phosphate transporter family protein [Pseudomonadota bacterium]